MRSSRTVAVRNSISHPQRGDIDFELVLLASGTTDPYFRRYLDRWHDAEVQPRGHSQLGW